MAEKNLEIQVKLTADTAGAQQAAAEIKRLADEANKKPFVMPIDEAGMKAREEAMRLQVQAAKQEAEAQEQVAKQTQKATAAQSEQVKVMASATTTANGASQAKKQLTDKTTQSAMGFLMFSQAVVDAQYGLRGILNNIPGMVMSFGGGAGLAGAVSLAAVGINILSENLDLFGTEAKKAQEEALKTEQELAKIAKQAEVAVKKSAELAESQKALADSIKFVSTAYEDQTKAADKALKKQQEILDAELKLSDATMERSMAMIDVQEAGGEISGSEATQRRSAVRAQAAAKRDEVEMRRLQAEEARMKAEADAAAKAAAAQEAIIKERFNAAREQKIMTDQERDAANKLRDLQNDQAGEAVLERRRAEAVTMPAGIMDPAQRAMIQQKIDDDIAKAREKEARSFAALRETQEKLDQDQFARRGSGTNNRDEFIRAREAAQKQAAEFKQQQEAAAEAARSAAGRAGVLAETIPMRQETEALKTAAAERQRQRDEQQKQEQEAARQEERMRREREQVGTAGGRLAEALTQGGASSAFVGQLQSAVAQTAAGGSTEQLMQLMQTLMANLSKMDAATREKLQKLQAEVNDLAVAK